MEIREVRVGQPFVVALEAASGTGYRWTVASDASDVESLGDPALADAGGMPGASRRTEITLIARTPGEHAIVLRLQRPWEDGFADEQRIVVVAR